MKKKLLVVEDDLSLANGIKLALKSSEVSIMTVNSISEAKKKLNEESIDLVILDINLPDGNGLDFLTYCKEKYKVKVIMLTANDMETDVVTGFEMGADDYITKPFSLMILRARVKAQLRNQVASHTYTTDIFEFDFDRMSFKKNNDLIELSKTEQKLLRILVENRGQNIRRELLIDKIWTEDIAYVDENALSVTIKRLRNKLEDDPSKPSYIKTIYGIGYTWVVD